MTRTVRKLVESFDTAGDVTVLKKEKQVITAPAGTHWFGDTSIPSTLIVRHCYLRHLQKWYTAWPVVPTLVVVGTPGTGKSVFVVIAFLYAMSIGVSVVVHTKNTERCILYTQKTRGDKTYIRAKPAPAALPAACWYVVDSVQPRAAANRPARTIVASSPDEDQSFHDIVKVPRTQVG